MLRPRDGRKHTLSVALPASVVENAQTGELKALLVGQIARALTIFSVDEVVLYEDQSGAQKPDDGGGASRGLAFFARNLQYLETPQYLRRQLLPMHRDLKWVGILHTLDAPHHLRKYEQLAYREGAVLALEKAPEAPGEEVGCWVNCGLDEPVWLSKEIPRDVRVTVRLEKGDEPWPLRGTAVAPREPTTKLGIYWGYQTRIATSLKAVFDECPYEGGYDLTLGTSERGKAIEASELPRYRHLLLVFGGLGGLEEAIADEQSGYDGGMGAPALFHQYINVCPQQTSRTIRTEEALLIALTALSPRHQGGG